jgi:hypothetical protein
MMMTKQLLNGSHIAPSFQQMGRERMPQDMTGHSLGNAREIGRLFHRSIQRTGMFAESVWMNPRTGSVVLEHEKLAHPHRVGTSVLGE